MAQVTVETLEPTTARRAAPIKWWAAAGALIVAFEAWVMIRWVTGPFFKTVPTGPSELPGYMKFFVIAFQVVSIPAALFCVYWFLIRPWRRTRRIGVDGALVIAFMTLWFQDPMTSYFGHWLVYNTHMLNYGSWVNSVPGWLPFGEPGAMLAEPILLIPGTWVWTNVGIMVLGCAVMRKAKARWPRTGTAGLIGICFGTMLVFDFVFEGLVFMPTGIWAYPGGHADISIFPDTYHKFPMNEWVTTSAQFTVVACFRYFVDDRGRTLVERGSERLRMSTAKVTVLRVLATIAFCQVITPLCQFPNYILAANSDTWPKDLVERSYFTNFLCGDQTPRACPGPAVPLIRNDNSASGRGSAYLRPDGTLGVPPNQQLPEVIPFKIHN